MSFGTGIGPSDLHLSLGSLAIHLPDGGAIHIEGFNADDPGANPVIDTFEFVDGMTLSYHQVIERGFDIVGTSEDDRLQGTATVDRILALAGDDTVFAGAGADRLEGGAGSDFLDGGEGDDWLAGGLDDDRYAFGQDSGQDAVFDEGGAADAVVMNGALTQADITLVRDGDDVVLGLKGSADRLTLKNWYVDDNRLEAIEFADGSTLDAAAIDRAVSRVPLTARDDSARTGEDDGLAVVGNVLSNDGEGDGAVLAVANPGVHRGRYGRLTLAADGSYAYELDPEAAAVQALAQGQTVIRRIRLYGHRQRPAESPSGRSHPHRQNRRR